jgi:hypothetical protein
MSVTRRLIEDAECAKRLGPCRKVLGATDLEGIEAASAHEQELVDEDLSGGTQFALVSALFAQHARLRVGTPVAMASIVSR